MRSLSTRRALTTVFVLGLAIGTACSSTPSGTGGPSVDAGPAVDAGPSGPSGDACTGACTPETGPPQPVPEAGVCNDLGAACGNGAVCCSKTICDNGDCCVATGAACEQSTDCCDFPSGDTACVAGKCGPKPPAPACYDKDEALAQKGTAPRRRPGLCTPAEIVALETACLGSEGPTSATCTAALNTNRNCGRCVVGALGGDDPATTPVGAAITLATNTLGPNVASCAALVIGRPECAVPLAQEVVCVSTACQVCEAADEAACEVAAETGTCKLFGSLAPVVCNVAVRNGVAMWTPVCTGANASETYRKVAAELCGSP